VAFHDLVAHARAFSTIDDPLREQLARGQAPVAMFITCSDSRIVPSAITGARPGDLFELRTAGNVIPAGRSEDAPTSEIATIEFAINLLGVPDIILCGHSQCGAVAALTGAYDPARLPMVERWLATATRTQPAGAVGDAGRRHLLAQFAALAEIPLVRARVDRNELTLHCWFYDIGSGVVSRWADGDEPSFREL